MNKIKDQLLKMQEQVEKKYKKESKYNFNINFDEDFVVNECMLKVFNKDFDIDNDKFKIVIMLLKYPKDEVIPFDEYVCVFGIQFGDICIIDSLLQSDDYEKVFSKYSELEKIIDTKDIDFIIKKLV